MNVYFDSFMSCNATLHISTETVNLTFFGQSHIFHIVPNNFPLPEEGIIGINFFSKYRRYAITSEFLILYNIKLSSTMTENLSLEGQQKYLE